MTKTGLHLLLR